jgi:hypothetical protein
MTTVVQFSGGIDSLVALWMHKGRADTCALWIKTDGAYPGAQERVEAACKAAGLPLYIEYTAREHLAYGFPADVVTQDLTALGRFVLGSNGAVLQSAYECCGRAIWLPMQVRTEALGAKVIVRGTKRCDKRSAHVLPGTVIGSVRYDAPVFEWTPEKVMEFAARECPEHIPPYYSAGEKTSRDCWDCTAYLDENIKRMSNLDAAQKRIVQGRLRFIASAAHIALDAVRAAGLATDAQEQEVSA